MSKVIGKILSAFAVVVILAGCGSSSGSSNSSAAIPPTPPPGPVTGLHLAIDSGNNQTAIVNSFLSMPLTVKVTDDNGDPVAGQDVKFTATGGVLSSSNVKTNTSGKAATMYKVTGSLGSLTITANAPNVGTVTFVASGRLPTLGEVSGGTVAVGTTSESISNYSALLTTLEGYGEVIVLIQGTDPSIDLSALPKAGQLLGGTIQGTLANNYPVVFASIADVIDAPLATDPAGSDVAGRYLASDKTDDLPVVTNLIVNGDVGVVGIIGDPTGITTDTLGGLIASGATVMGQPIADLPVYLVKAEDFPANPADSLYSYSTTSTGIAPLYDGIDTVSGGGATYIPLASISIPATTSKSLVTITGGIAGGGLKIINPPALVGSAANKATLTPLPVEYIEVFNVVQNEIAPLVTAAEPTMTAIATDMQQIGQILQDNQALLQGLADGTIDPTNLSTIGPLLDFMNDLLPEIDSLLGNFIALIPTIDAQLDAINNDLLPAISDALPADGIAFGGQSDGDGSTVRDDVLPFISDQIVIMQAALPAVTQLLTDLRDLLPNSVNGMNIISIIGDLMGGGLDTIAGDLNAFVPFMTMAAESFDASGIPIMFDMLEQAEATYVPGSSPISGLDGFQTMVDSVTAALPPGATLGDLPGFDQWGGQLATYLPPELGDPASISIFDTILPALGSVDIGADVLPAMRTGLEQLDTAMPEIITTISSFVFDFSNIGGMIGGGGGGFPF